MQVRLRAIGASPSLRRSKTVRRGLLQFALLVHSPEEYSAQSSTAGPVKESSWSAEVTLRCAT